MPTYSPSNTLEMCHDKLSSNEIDFWKFVIFVGMTRRRYIHRLRLWTRLSRNIIWAISTSRETKTSQRETSNNQYIHCQKYRYTLITYMSTFKVWQMFHFVRGYYCNLCNRGAPMHKNLIWSGQKIVKTKGLSQSVYIFRQKKHIM